MGGSDSPRDTAGHMPRHLRPRCCTTGCHRWPPLLLTEDEQPGVLAPGRPCRAWACTVPSPRPSIPTPSSVTRRSGRLLLADRGRAATRATCPLSDRSRLRESIRSITSVQGHWWECMRQRGQRWGRTSALVEGILRLAWPSTPNTTNRRPTEPTVLWMCYAPRASSRVRSDPQSSLVPARPQSQTAPRTPEHQRQSAND